MEELKKRLEGVCDSYPDFVKGVLVCTKGDEEKRRRLIEYMEKHAGATSSQIIEYLDKTEGLIKEPLEELRELLESLGDSYPDFVNDVLGSSKRNAAMQEKIIFFIKQNKTATSSDVLEYLDGLEEQEKELQEYLEHIPRMYDDLKNVALRYARRNAGSWDKLAEFMRNNPDADKSGIAEFICENDERIPGKI